MILKGRVNRLDEPEIIIALIIRGKRHRVTAVIDTGFNGYLCIPESISKYWYFIGYEEYEIATGDIVKQKIFLGQMVWNGGLREMHAVSSRSKDVLIGTKLLRHNMLSIDFVRKKVMIE